ncbi:hypothetical protein MRX96_002897 [Rhipicephalus microplus]
MAGVAAVEAETDDLDNFRGEDGHVPLKQTQDWRDIDTNRGTENPDNRDEIMHGLDIRSWGELFYIPDEVKKGHNKRALCLRRSHRSVLPSSRQRDEFFGTAESENLADFVGTMLAYAAFASSAEEDRKVKLAGYDKSPDQLFFISQWTVMNPNKKCTYW